VVLKATQYMGLLQIQVFFRKTGIVSTAYLVTISNSFTEQHIF